MTKRNLFRRGTLALAALLLTAPSASAASSDGWLQTAGTQIKDVNGRQVLLTGAQSVNGVSDSTVRLLQAAGLNSVRMTVPWERLEGAKPTLSGGGLQHHWSTGWLNGLDAQVARLAQGHIRVILEFHQSQWSSAFVGNRKHAIGMPRWLYPGAPSNGGDAATVRFFTNQNWPGFSLGSWKPQELMVEAMKFLAQRYQGNSYVVGFDLMNEPGWSPSKVPGLTMPNAHDLLSFYQKAAQGLHNVNPRLLIVYETGTFAQAAYRGGTILDAGTGGLNVPNAVASWHYYPAPPMNERQFGLLVDQSNLAKRWNQPLYIGEFNAYDAGYDNAKQRTFGNQWRTLTQQLMAFTRKNSIGWSFWAFQRGAGATLISKSGSLKGDIVGVLRQGQL